MYNYITGQVMRHYYLSKQKFGHCSQPIVCRTEALIITPPSLIVDMTIGELDISGNNLRTVPVDICKLTELRALNLSQNGIKCSSATDYSGLPKELSRLRHLEVSPIKGQS